jgi:hypothetical protein
MQYFGVTGLNPGIRVLLGCDWLGFVKGLEDQFADGMSWDNFGSGDGEWEVHHIIALSRWNMRDPIQVLLCNHIANLTPMWSGENGWKSDHTTAADAELLESRLQRLLPEGGEQLKAQRIFIKTHDSPW